MLLQESTTHVSAIADQLASETKPGFAAEVEGLMRRIRTVLVNTAKFQLYIDDPETLIDLQVSFFIIILSQYLFLFQVL